MQNGYFRLINMTGGFGIKIVAPKDGGESIRLNELMDYLKYYNITYEQAYLLQKIKDYNGPIFLGPGDCPVANENYTIRMTPDNMEAYVRFQMPSHTGDRISKDEFLKDLKFRNVIAGIDEDAVNAHFESGGIYCTDILIAK